MRSIFKILVLSVVTAGLIGCAAETKEQQFSKFLSKYEKRIKPFDKEARLADWTAANTGKEADYKKSADMSLKLLKIYANPKEFAFLKAMKESGEVKNPLLARQLDYLYNYYLANQIDPVLMKQIVDLGSQVQQKFNTFRGKIDGNSVTDNEIKEILKKETNSEKRQKAWLASKQVAPVVKDDLIKLIKLRNQAARKLGFENYHTMSLTLSEQSVPELDKIFKELYELTKESFAKEKAELDAVLAKNCGIEPSQIQPWHYHDPFFQETPLVYNVDLDSYYEGKDAVQIAVKYYDGIGLPVEAILARSDMYEREGKNPHAFCTDMDKAGDVRILCNMKNNDQWMETILHELGHAVYDTYKDPNVPYLIREPAHIFTTEAIAMFFGRLSKDPDWMQQMLSLTDDQRNQIATVSGKYAKLKQLIFARWAMVMYDFEKQLYANPDQDLNTLWWQIVEKYQLIKKPEGRNEPDWASKIHFTIAPCYYHNYLIAELFGSQIHNYVNKNVIHTDNPKGYVGEKRLGEYLKKNIFYPGAVNRWDKMIENATGEPLTAKYFVEQFVK